MTKFILHGGDSKEPSGKIKDFFYEIFENIKLGSSPVNILIVCFARYKEDWPSVFQKYTNRYRAYYGNAPLNFLLADPDKKKFIDQLKRSKIINFCGGGEASIKKYITKRKDIEPYLSNKIITGTSAGANILSRYYYSNDRNKIEKGLGILPIKTICHYSAEKNDRLKKLSEYNRGKDLLSCPIKENEFIVFYS